MSGRAREHPRTRPFALPRALAYKPPPPMERSLRNRLTFGPIMLAGLFLLLWLDHMAQQWTAGAYTYRNEPQGVAGLGLLVLLLIILPGATVELAHLFAAERVRPSRVIAAAG